jgi:hypothetical protein
MHCSDHLFASMCFLSGSAVLLVQSPSASSGTKSRSDSQIDAAAGLSSSPLKTVHQMDRSQTTRALVDEETAAGDRKSVTLMARDPEEKAKWMADLQALVAQSSKNKKTLMTK